MAPRMLDRTPPRTTPRHHRRRRLRGASALSRHDATRRATTAHCQPSPQPCPNVPKPPASPLPGALEPLGASALSRVRSRFVPLPPPPAQRVHVVLLSRADMGRKRPLSNEAELLRALRSSAAATATFFPPHASPPGLDVQRYVGSDKLSLAATAQVRLTEWGSA